MIVKSAPSRESEGANFTLFIAENAPKISASGQTCGQRRKMGLFNPRSREEQARCLYGKNARFQEILRKNKRKSEVRLNLRFCLESYFLIHLLFIHPFGRIISLCNHLKFLKIQSFIEWSFRSQKSINSFLYQYII